jgi:uncharacterized protein (TIGR03382 family)
LTHASGFLTATGARLPEEAARAFLDAQGPAFGVSDLHELEPLSFPEPGDVAAVHFRRLVSGLPVFGGDVVVGVDGENRVFLVNTTEVSPVTTGSHDLADEDAVSIALGSFGYTVYGPGSVTVARGWRQFGRDLRAVYQVDFIARDPAGDWRVYVDGETGRALYRQNRRAHASAPGNVYETSPTETVEAICPAAGTGGLTFCANPVSVTLLNLTSGTDLTGSQTTVYNCKGTDVPTNAKVIPSTCNAVAAVSGGFSFDADKTWRSTTDDFAGVMAYYHLDKFATFVKGIDPALPPASYGKRALSGSLPALVNIYQNSKPLENAYYSPAGDFMAFGQGATADFAYDGTIIYHEFTHGIVQAWGGFTDRWDAMGLLNDPSSVNEGTADAMTAARTKRSQLGGFTSSANPKPTTYMRDMDDKAAKRTCQGDGTEVTQRGYTGVNGLDGETHDDGEIWNSLYWEIFQGLKNANVTGCSGACDAGSAIQYKALQLAGGGSPTFDSYWKTFKAAAVALFPTKPAVANYVTCVAQRRGYDKCNRLVPIYAGESKVQDIDTALSSFQMTVNVTGAGAQVMVCSTEGTAATIHASNGAPVQVDPATLAVTATKSANATQKCWSQATLTLDAVGTWYLLLKAPTLQDPLSDTFVVQVGKTGVATRPTPSPPITCQYAFDALSISPASATVATGGTANFTATGGSGTGYVWALASNPSGGTMNAATGAYTAGAASGVTDVVRVTDSASNTATASLAVTATPVPPVPPAPSSKGCSTAGGADALTLAAVSAFLLLGRRRKLVARPVDGRE